MNVLVTGGAASGKSACAERIACTLSPARTYVATMAPDGAEAQARIARHRRMREGLDFSTVECPASLRDVAGDPAGVALVEDVGNLVANALFRTDGTMADPRAVADRIDQELAELAARFAHAVVVTNETGCEGRSPYAATKAWIRTVGAVSCSFAARADVVAEVASGIAYAVKGTLPCL